MIDGPRKLVNGKLVPLSSADIRQQTADEAAHAEQFGRRMKAAVNFERDRRVAAGFPFREKIIQADAKSQAAIVSMAAAAMVSPKFETLWITKDNSILILDRDGALEMAGALFGWQEKHARAARDLKGAVSVPLDYMDERFW